MLRICLLYTCEIVFRRTDGVRFLRPEGAHNIKYINAHKVSIQDGIKTACVLMVCKHTHTHMHTRWRCNSNNNYYYFTTNRGEITTFLSTLDAAPYYPDMCRRNGQSSMLCNGGEQKVLSTNEKRVHHNF